MTSWHGKQTIAVHILPNISKRKGIQAMKFGQLIEHKHFFSKNYTQNVVKKLFPVPFLKKQN